jgi:heme-degrading monooxygenase HmoA
MFVVAFEVQPRLDAWDEYLQTAKLLRPELERIDGFIHNERFRSRRHEDRLLSLSTWRDEKAVGQVACARPAPRGRPAARSA